MSSKHSAPQAARLSHSRWLVATAVAAAITGSAFAADGLEEVTVTGSRIARTRDLEASSPVVTVTTQSFDNSATTSVESVLNKLPQFNPAGSQFVSGAQSSPTVTPGAATVDLRGLGINRTLVLIDGRRGQPANATLAIDVNTIPQAAIQGVEVITGGASAVYGPDALAGVVNFTLKKDFQGLTVDLQSGMTEQGGGAENKFSALMGMNSADGRGNIMVGLDWAKRSAVLMRDRDFFVNGWRDPGNPGGDFVQAPSFVGNPTSAAVSSVFGNPATVPGTSSQFYFNADGTPFVSQGALGYKGPYGALDAGRYTMAVKLTNGNLDQKYTTQFASTPLERHSFFVRGRYDITDDLQAFVQANYSNVDVTTKGNFAPAVTLWSVSVPRDGRTLPAALNTLLDSRPNPAANWTLYQVPNYFGPLIGQNTTNLYQMMAGLSGKLGIKDWTWEAYYSHGDTQTYAEVAYPSLQRYQMLIAAPNFGKGANITSAPAGVPSGRGYSLTCTTGLPIFNEFTPSADCLNSMTTRSKQLTSLRQDVVEANAQGSMFALPAGDVRGAVGATWRQDTFRFDPGNPVEQILDNPIGLFASNATGGKTAVREGYIEALVPVVKNLELELGWRYSNFNTAGGESTYKGMFSWKAMDSLTIRGGYQVATRAPNVAELYAGKRLEVVAFPSVDPCSAVTVSPWGNVPGNANRTKVQALCRALIGNSTSEFDTQNFNANTIWKNAFWNNQALGSGPNGWTRQAPPFFPLEIETEQGNPNVKPETAKTITLGAVINQPFDIANLVMTVDAYSIKVTDTIARLSSITAYNNCFNFDGASNPTYSATNYYCSLIKRDPITGDRSEVASLYLNLGTLETRGVDLAVGWKHDLGPGQFSVHSTLSYLDKFDYQPDKTQPLVHAAGTLDKGGQFKYRLLTDLGYHFKNDFSVGLQWRHLPAVDNAAKALTPTTTIQGTPAYDLFNLTAGYTMGRYQLRAGIDNLLDKAPPVVGANPAAGDTNSDQTNAQYYDILGRRFYVGVKAKF